MYTYVYTEQNSYEPLAQIQSFRQPEKHKTDVKPTIYYYHTDQIGIPREMTDETGKIVWQGRYSAWGKLLHEEKANSSIHQPFRLQNQYADEETGLHYNFFRYYDPHCGRFTQQDPIKLAGGDNLYTFAPNANHWVDPLGLDKIIKILVSTDMVGQHAGMGIFDTNGKNILLYDPNGSYKSSKCSDCANGRTGSGDFFDHNQFDWNEYKKYHEDSDGKEDIHIYQFRVTDEVARSIESRIINDNCQNTFLYCTSCTIWALQAGNNQTFKFIESTMFPMSLNRQLKSKGIKLQ